MQSLHEETKMEGKGEPGLQNVVHDKSLNLGEGDLFLQSEIETFGKASNLVENAHLLQTIKIEAFAKDALIGLVERLFRVQVEFRRQHIPAHVDIAYHQTSSKNLGSIQTHGLLTHVDLREKSIPFRFHGSAHGEGIYCTDDASRHATESYGDTTIVLARIKGVELPRLSILRCNTFNVGNICVLRESNQCVPLFHFPSRLIGMRGMREMPDAIFSEILAKFHEDVQQHLLDKYFNDCPPIRRVDRWLDFRQTLRSFFNLTPKCETAIPSTIPPNVDMHNVKIIENCNSITDLEALTTFLTQGQTENDRLLYMIAEKRLKTVEYHEKVNAQVRAIIKPQEEQETTAVPTPARHPLQPHSTPTPGSLHPMNTTTPWSFSIFTPANAKGLGATGGISDQHKSMGALTAISRPAPAHNHDLDREERKELLELIEKLKKKVDERCKEKGIDDITRIARQRRKHEIHSIFADPEAKLSIEGIVDRTRRIDRLAHNSFLQGKELVARHYYTLAIRCIPKDCLDQIEIAKVLSDIHSQRAYLYLKKQEYELSLSDCNRAIQLNPDSRKPYDIKSSALLALGRDSEHLLHLRDYHKLKGVKTREELSSCLNELDLGSSGDASGNMSDREDRTGLPETTAHTSTDDGNNKVLRSARIGLSAFSLYERPSKLLKPTI